MSKSILIVDDDELMRSFLSTILKEEGHRIEVAGNGKEGLAKLQATEFDLVITDLRMPDISGLDLMREGGKAKPDTKWIVITAFGSIGNAVEAVKAGASDYLTKPFHNPDELRHVIRRVLREAEAERTISLLAEELGRQFPPVEMIFLGEKMQEVYRMVQEVAPTPATVLISGPSGTGKELVARVIHQLSPRQNKPFVAVHCAALAETLLESELFGHERGAFTGAVSARKGRFELADNGTLFLDEIGEIAPSIQVKLLRVLQEREFERVGGMKSLSVNVRVISATNKELKTEVSPGRLREDLFYRLNVFPVRLPPLVERREAILPLADFFAKKFAAAFGKKMDGFTPSARSALLEYGWPGNIRELQNVIERALILSSGKIDVLHLNLETPTQTQPAAEGLLKASERETIRKILSEVGGNRKRAAEILGISVRTLQYRIKEYGL
ncbi:MAG: sigma-54-dependent Fis family transcriptional regulator [Deltaproteobacteria bacterium]|nr:sigma-54-dependent Fis family transcriptional regulator [Deltaproteobacteria bacterium]